VRQMKHLIITYPIMELSFLQEPMSY